MTNFARNLSGIPTDRVPVVPNDDDDNVGDFCIGFWVNTTAGNIRYISADGMTRDINAPIATDIPQRATRVLASGTTAVGIQAAQG